RRLERALLVGAALDEEDRDLAAVGPKPRLGEMTGDLRELPYRPVAEVRDVELQLVRLRRVGEEGQRSPVGTEVEVVFVVRLAVFPGGEADRSGGRGRPVQDLDDRLVRRRPVGRRHLLYPADARSVPR